MFSDRTYPSSLPSLLQRREKFIRRKNMENFGKKKNNIFPSQPVILAYSATRANYIAHYANRVRLAYVSRHF